MPTARSTLAFCFLSSIKDKQDYPQNRIIFKIDLNSLPHKELAA